MDNNKLPPNLEDDDNKSESHGLDVSHREDELFNEKFLEWRNNPNREIELPKNPFVVKMVNFAYGNLDEEETKKLKDICETEKYLKTTLEEIIKEKEANGFQNAREHLLLMEDESRRLASSYRLHGILKNLKT